MPPRRRDSGDGATRRSDPAIPWRTTLSVIGVVLATAAAVLFLWKLRQVIMWLAVASFLAVGLAPPVGWLQRRLHIRRTLAILVVFVIGLGMVTGVVYVVVRPLVSQARDFADNLPTYVEQAQRGEGTIGHLVKRFKLERWVNEHSDALSSALTSSGKPALGVVRTVTGTVVSLVTILVLTILLLVEAPSMIESGLGMLSPPRRERVVKIAADCSKAVSGYVAGNLLISVIAGAVTFVTLLLLGVPFAAPLALWVAVADLIPLVGATLGAIPTVAVAFLHSVPAGVITLVVYILYQQFENHVLQVTIMARTVALNPLLVLISVLVGVQLLGFVGALLAIPVGGIIQVIVRDVYVHRRGAATAEDETLSDVDTGEAAATLGIDAEHVSGDGDTRADAAHDEGTSNASNGSPTTEARRGQR